MHLLAGVQQIWKEADEFMRHLRDRINRNKNQYIWILWGGEEGTKREREEEKKEEKWGEGGENQGFCSNITADTVTLKYKT